MHNEFDLMREFDEFLDAVYDEVSIAGMDFFPNQILKSDQHAYRKKFLDWCNSNGYEY